MSSKNKKGAGKRSGQLARGIKAPRHQNHDAPQPEAARSRVTTASQLVDPERAAQKQPHSSIDHPFHLPRTPFLPILAIYRRVWKQPLLDIYFRSTISALTAVLSLAYKHGELPCLSLGFGLVCANNLS